MTVLEITLGLACLLLVIVAGALAAALIDATETLETVRVHNDFLTATHAEQVKRLNQKDQVFANIKDAAELGERTL
jgi:hypothetical protein